MSSAPAQIDRARERRRIAVRGVVQGVGFRPFVHATAERLALSGFVQNRVGEVRIEVEGAPAAVDALVAELRLRPPPLARIDAVELEPLVTRGDATFSIAPSDAAEPRPLPALAPDAGPCAACLAELADPQARRFDYALLSCTDCGPRLTIATGAPYDRERTTMAAFALCEACLAEQRDPRDRRFHAQPIACPACGPRLVLEERGARARQDGAAAIDGAARAIASGAIVAVKSVGGYHLACDATNEVATSTLRARKRRDAKPFALLVADLEAARALADFGPEEARLLASSARPIVLLRRRADAGVASSVAPGLGLLGLMLPPSPMHHLLARRVARPLVMTSGNVSDEPIAIDDADARTRLAPIADALLVHDRRIALRCDDSVARVIAGAPRWLRRSRGAAPLPVALPSPVARPTLAVGGDLKAAFALGAGACAVPGPHGGDLGELSALRAFEDAVSRFEALLGCRPARLAHDLHPDYASTRYALERAGREGLELVAVQHHHAHFAGCLAEHGVSGPAIGVVFDGAGLGEDGTIWGGELLVGDARRAARAGHLGCVPLPGGDAAAREPWRMAIAHLVAAGADPAQAPFFDAIGARDVLAVARLCERPSLAPPASSVGRLFDAVAALAGLGLRARYEAELPMRLESAAATAGDDAGEPYPLPLRDTSEGFELDPAPLVRAVLADVRAGVAAPLVARRFHAGLAAAIVAACERLRAELGVGVVALTGGVFANALLSELASAALERRGFVVLFPQQLPMNDGGLAFGQLAVVAARDGEA